MKKAFTLAEILLVLLIVGILLGLCMGAGRVHLEKAYNLYFYRSYAGLNTVFNDFLYKGKHHEYQLTNSTTLEYKYLGKSGVVNAFNEHLDSLTQSGRGGIDYAVSQEGTHFIKVLVKVPALKSSKNPDGEKIEYEVLLTTGYNLAGGTERETLPLIMISNDNGTGIIDSIGILPAFLDDGEAGTYGYDENGVLKYKPIIQMSLRQAFCTMPQEYELSPTRQEISTGAKLYGEICNNQGITQNTDKANNTIRLLKPSGYRG